MSGRDGARLVEVRSSEPGQEFESIISNPPGQKDDINSWARRKRFACQEAESGERQRLHSLER
jgi:hypothetical protein